MSKLKLKNKRKKNSKSIRTILVIKKGDSWDEDIYVKPYPRSQMRNWMKKLHDTGTSNNPLAEAFDLMAMFTGLCICDKSGEALADDSQESIDYLLDLDELPQLYEASCKVSGMIRIGKELLAIIDEMSKESAEDDASEKK